MQFTKHLGGLACCESCWGDVAGDDGPGAYDRSIADVDSFEDDAVGSDEYVFADVNWGDLDRVARCEWNFMHVGVAYEATCANKAAFTDMDAGAGDDS